MSSRFTVGLTGGIASGKTTASNRFGQLGTVVIDSDEIARQLVEPGQPLLSAVIDTFGAGLLGANGELDRAKLRQIIFDEPNHRRKLEAILHPAIRQETDQRVELAASPYVVIAIPLLFETDSASRFSRVLVIDVPLNVQIDRLMHRDGATAAEAERILSAQANRDQRLRLADDVIRNNGSIEQLLAQVERLHLEYSTLCLDRNCSHDPHDAQSALS